VKALIRYLRQGPDGVIEAQDSDATVNELTIGSAADRQIQLIGREVGADHAAIRASGGKLAIACRGRFRVQINGKSVASGSLALGDQIDIAGHKLRLFKPPAGFDVAIEVTLTSADASEFENAFRTDLDKTWLSKRSGAWLLAILTLLLALALPLQSVFIHRQGKPTPIPSVDDALWSAGPLSPAHELAAGKKCSACHQQLFVHVQDTACRDCHRSVADHIAASTQALAHLGTQQRCAQCHREHDGGASQIAVRDDTLCVGCHADPGASFGSIPRKLGAVSGFARGTHPAFSIQLLKPPAGSEMAALQDWVQSREPLATARERSNLKFSHQQHLDGARVTRARDGGVLGCADCHTLENDGQHFLPVTMETSCASCHQLTFDPNEPTRQLPHGKPLDAIYVIEDYFARKYSDPTLPVKKSTQARRLPDKEIPTDLADVCTGPSYICANRRAAAEIENQFAGRGCVSCHEVQDSHAKDIQERFQVIPVHLTQDYFEKARFNHRAHAVQKNLTGDAACLSCHKAKDSKESSQVMIPDIGNCLQCHSNRYVKDQVTVQCVSCHSYHPMAIMQANSQEQ